MQKKGVILSVLVLVLFVSVFSSVMVSASWFSDVFGKITGNAISTERDSQKFDEGVVWKLEAGVTNLVGNFILDDGNSYVTGVSINWTDYDGKCQAKIIVGDYSSDFSDIGNNVKKGFWSINKVADRVKVKINLDSSDFYYCSKVKINSLTVWYNKTEDAPTENSICTDSDGGLNYNIKGAVTANWAGELVSEMHTYEDWCDGSSVVENYCSTDLVPGMNAAAGTSYVCPNGCSDGACKNATVSPVNVTRTCTDSDGGLNYNVKGDIVATGGSFSVPYTDVDKCGGPEVDGEVQENVLNEHYCNSDGPSNQLYTCPNGCSNGACVGVSTPLVNCNSVIDFMEAPKSLVIGNNGEYKWNLNYNSSYDYGNGDKFYYAYWAHNNGNENSYVQMSVEKLSDKIDVEQRLNNALENGLCDTQQVWTDYKTNEAQIVYLCKNIWRIANENQRVSSSGNAWNYQNDVVAIWFNDDKLFNAEFSTNNYWSCYSDEDCRNRENENHQRGQQDLINVVDKLINNQNRWVSSGNLDYKDQVFIRYFLDACESDVLWTDDFSSWQCRMDPVICPPHGEQVQKCSRYNNDLGKEESRQTTLSCSPGMCSGCMIPKWFESNYDSKCIEYGFRFGYQTGWDLVDNYVNYSNQDGLTVGDASRYPQEMNLTVFANDTAYLELREAQDEVLRFNLEIGKYYPLRGYGNVNYTLFVNDIGYDSENYNKSYITVTVYAQGYERYSVPSTINAYCDIDGQVKQQKVSAGGEWAKCQNNYECDSNLCSSGECIDLQAIAKDANALKNAWVSITCKITSFLGIDASYTQCMYDSFGVGGTSTSTGGGGGSGGSSA